MIILIKRMSPQIEFYIVSWLIANFFIFSLSPIENENRLYDLNEKKYFRKYTLYILGIENIINIITLILNYKIIFVSITIGMVLSATLVAIGKHKIIRLKNID